MYTNFLSFLLFSLIRKWTMTGLNFKCINCKRQSRTAGSAFIAFIVRNAFLSSQKLSCPLFNQIRQSWCFPFNEKLSLLVGKIGACLHWYSFLIPIDIVIFLIFSCIDFWQLHFLMFCNIQNLVAFSSNLDLSNCLSIKAEKFLPIHSLSY